MTTQLEATTASNALSEPEYWIPAVGMVIEGQTVMEFHRTQERIKGDTFATWGILTKRENEFHEFAVLQLIARPEGWSMGHGNYFHTYEEAIEFYNERVK